MHTIFALWGFGYCERGSSARCVMRQTNVMHDIMVNHRREYPDELLPGVVVAFSSNRGEEIGIPNSNVTKPVPRYIGSL